ncbi:hypothetical protein [Shumkonia mesophila]|uniref:hypothetical protein n=1 Tax=Shumkonia mesophila TaxID=2838854 RepID=UPI00293450E4|nr:hypothetical protein [Shumkonia mesophila]
MVTTDLRAAPTAPPPALAPPAGQSDAATADGETPFALFGEDGFTFADLLDIVNPLQHIPVIGTIYRRITGDTLDPGARLAGGALFGGVIGVAVAGVNAALEDATGKDAGEHVLAWFEDGSAAQPGTAVAETTGGAAVPDLALLGPLPAPAADTAPSPASRPAAPIDLAALAPLAPPSSAVLVAAMPDAGRAADPAAAPPARRTASSAAIPPGALAGEGGWFTQTMLAAMERYQDAQRLQAKTDGTMAAATN